MKFRKKPVVIEAFQLKYDNINEILKWSTKKNPIVIFTEKIETENTGEVIVKYAEIKTLEGTMSAEPNDWIIKGVKGEVYPCKPDIFEMTYEKTF